MNFVEEIIQKGETERTALFPARSPMASVGHTVCGMLNQQGGSVVWGVGRDGEPSDMPHAEEKCQRLIDYLMRHLARRPLLSVTVEKVRGKRVVLVEIPPSQDKPFSLEREIWVRVGKQTLRASDDASYRMVERSAVRISGWERDILPGFELTDCDREEMADARREIVESGRFGIEVPGEDEELLRRLYLMKSGQLTNAAMVLFASDPLRWSPNLALRVVSYASGKQGAALHEQTLHGPAVRVLRQAISVIQQQTGVTARFKQGQLQREDRPAYATYALREGLVNAIVHRDYEALSGQLRVEIFPDRLTIQNPGELPEGWTEKDIVRKEESHPTNPEIARVFHLRELMERLGLGGRRLVESCAKLKAKRPEWKADKGVVSLTIYRAPQTESISQVLPRQREFLKTLAPDVEIKAEDYATAADVSLRQARRDLGDLCDLGLLERLGRGPATVYRQVGGGGHE